tara:strand:+ start:3487 stop:3630 length:144 start_codon:yes stop_codon:yes gene_type:complete
MSNQIIFVTTAIQRLPPKSFSEEVKGGDNNSEDENDNRKKHNFNVIN